MVALSTVLVLVFASIVLPALSNAYDPNNPQDVYDANRKNAEAKKKTQESADGVGAILLKTESDIEDLETSQIPAANSAAQIAQTNYDQAVDKAEKLKRRLETAQKDKERIEKQLDTATAQFDSSRVAIAALAREEMRGDEQTQTLNVIMNADNSQDFVESLETQSAAARTQARILNNAAFEKADAGTKDARLKLVNDLITKLKQEADDNEKAQLKSKHDAEIWQAQVKQMESQLVVKKANLERQKAQLEATLAQIKAQEAQLAADMANIASRPGGGGFDGSGGVLSFPVSNHGIMDGGYFMDPHYPFPQYPHQGVDFSYAGCGTPVFASADGNVATVGYLANSRGNYIVVNHGDTGGANLMTVYQHLIDRGYVSPNQWVTRGQRIGTVGATGFVTGCHLHFEVWRNQIPVNPLNYL